METFWLVFLMCGIQYGGVETAYFRRIKELGYFSVYLLNVTKPSSIQCASACVLVKNCFAASFSENLELCKLSSGTGMYIANTEWTSVLKNGQGAVESGTSPTTTTTSTTRVSLLTTTPEGTVGGAGGLVTCPNGFTATPSGSCFHVAPVLRTFARSQQACHNNGGYLATISSVTENLEVIGLLNQMTALHTNVYIGGSDHAVEGTWRWRTDHSFTWITGGPSNTDPEADCLAYSFAHAWEWTNVICAEIFASVCETAPI